MKTRTVSDKEIMDTAAVAVLRVVGRGQNLERFGTSVADLRQLAALEIVRTICAATKKGKLISNRMLYMRARSKVAQNIRWPGGICGSRNDANVMQLDALEGHDSTPAVRYITR